MATPRDSLLGGGRGGKPLQLCFAAIVWKPPFDVETGRTAVDDSGDRMDGGW